MTPPFSPYHNSMMNTIWLYWLLAVVTFLLYRCVCVMQRRLKQRSRLEMEQVINCDQGLFQCCRQFPSKCRYLLRPSDSENDASRRGISAAMRNGMPVATEEVVTEMDFEEMDTLADGEDTEGSEGMDEEGMEGDNEGEGTSDSVTMLQSPRKGQRNDSRSDDPVEGINIGTGFTRMLTFNIGALFRTKSTSPSPTSSPTSSSQLLPTFAQNNPMRNHEQPINPTSINPTPLVSSSTSPTTSPGVDTERTNTTSTFFNPRSFSFTSGHNPSHHPPSSSHYPSSGPSPRPSPSPGPQPRPQLAPQYIPTSSSLASTSARSLPLSLGLAGHQNDDNIRYPSTDIPPTNQIPPSKQTHPVVR